MTAVIDAGRDDPAAAPVVELAVRSEPDVASARLAARALGRGLDLGDATATRFATAVSEVCRNAVIHAGGGSIAFRLEVRGRQAAIVATVSDRGPGIADPEAAMTPRLGDPTGAGVGLSRARRLVDDLRIIPRDGGGSVVHLVRSVPAGAGARWAAAVSAIDDSRRGQPAGPSSTGADHVEEIGRLRTERERLAAELEETNRGVVALYAELEDQAEQLRRADELKSRFLSRVSHELRTPINSIVALSRLLADRVDGELTEGQATQVGYIQSAADELSGLVNDLLDLARIESGRVEVTPREFVIDELFGALRGTLRPLARPGVELRFEPTHGIPPLYTDEGKVGQIVRNFVSNALKFTEAGSVTVRAAFDPGAGRLRIEVADTGVGIAPDDLERVFDEFVQVPGAHQVGVKGTGLGLPVSRGLATLLGGEVGVTSAPGAGSTFWVDVPAIHVTRRADGDTPATQRTEGTVLVVDDDATARYLVHQQLAAQGLRLVEAATGEEGVELARGERPDVVVLDLSMPDLDGLEVLARLRAVADSATLPVIVHTARQLTRDELRAIDRAGATLLGKDARPGAVAASVRAALERDGPSDRSTAGGSPAPEAAAGAQPAARDDPR